MENSPNPPEGLTRGQVRRIVIVAFEETTGWMSGIVNADTEIECDFQDLLGRISQELKRKIVIVCEPLSGKFTIGELAEYIADHQAHFEPLPEKQDQKP